MDVSRDATEIVKIWLSLGAVLLVLGWRFLPLRPARIALVVLTLVAGLNYARWGPRLLAERVDTYDLIHYYLNSKYFDELGYYDLYPACIVADHEAFGPHFKEGTVYMAQSDAGHALEPIAHAVDRGRLVKETRFTPERWQAFSHDFLYLQRSLVGLDDKLWRQMIQDHGFNGTTAWTFLARPIASAVPVEYVKALGYVDVGLLAVAIGALAWAYGSVPALWTTFFLLVSYSARWPTFSWAFLRYDYLAGMLGALALLKKGKPFWAGVLTGYAASLRLFPAMWLYGPGAKGVAGLLGRKVHTHLLVLLGGLLIAVAGIHAATFAQMGLEPARVHLENMEDHNASQQLSSRRIGLALALPFRGELLPKALPASTKKVIETQKPIRYAIGGALLILLGWGLRRAEDDEGYAYGFLPLFFFTTASYYYYIVRAPLIAMHAARLDSTRNRVGLAMLFGMEAFSNWSEGRFPEHRVFLIGTLAWSILLYATVMAVWATVESYRGASPRSAGSLPKGSSTTSESGGASASAGAVVASSPQA